MKPLSSPRCCPAPSARNCSTSSAACKTKHLELNSKRAEQQQRRRTLAEQQIASELDAASLQQQLTEARSKQQAGNTRCGQLEQQLRATPKAQRQAQTQQQRIQQQRQIEERWHKLNALIGSGDDKKFRNFAQSLNFEIMVANANSQLRKLSDRYLLVHDPGQALELQVLDNYQAGAMRPTQKPLGWRKASSSASPSPWPRADGEATNPRRLTIHR